MILTAPMAAEAEGAREEKVQIRGDLTMQATGMLTNDMTMRGHESKDHNGNQGIRE